ncbi:VOC family protein [Streptomyces armeniacus]|uniref:VOC family protein n=1 Tax=Streptomyces armeniacus TaxID=83291 RepID=A0A345XP47_9ACTN|nr:VOC family protein [Streptomyces armeniacus]AXK33413.1 VOC family protein [Streptomyces armeniacus]
MTEAAIRHQHTTGTPCWASLMVHGLPASREFYHGLFGWEYRHGPQQLEPYVRAVVNGREVAGMGEMTSARAQPHIAWMPYMSTEDADTTAGLVRECGGTVAVGPLDVENAGRLAIAADPTGGTFGIWQPGTHLGLGTSEAGAPGTPVWFELVTRETSSVGKFYPAVFGYEAEAVVSADFDYVTLHLDGRPVAGVHGVGRDLPRDRGPHWETYFAVEDTDAAARLVTELGGHVVRPPRDSPYGRLATVIDPEGAQFSVIRLAERDGG